MDTTAIILAVASPPGRAPRGIVRLSGPGTHDLLSPLLTPLLTPPLAPPATAPLLRPDVLRLDDRDLPCLAVMFHGPRSYTGEDAAELQLAGNPMLLERTIDAIIASAARRGIETRRAEPGEFTARAFLHGRLGLIEAEGVAATIAARSDAELRAARMLLAGRLGDFARDCADRLAAGLALVEAGIDFTDQEDVQPIAPAALCDLVTRLRDEIRACLDRAVGFERLEAIPWVVLAGVANAGKSTLFNALLGRERAVVSQMAGTTRDVLAEPLTVPTDHGPAEVMLVDVAGEEDAVDVHADTDTDALEGAMRDAARRAVERAELVLLCSPGGAATTPRANTPTIRVATMADRVPPPAATGPPDAVVVSARTGAGLDTLRSMIGDRLSDHAVSLAADTLALGPRHEAALRDAAANLDETLAIAARSRDERVLAEVELVASAMRAALDALAALAGNVTPDDVLGRIFAGFCIGK